MNKEMMEEKYILVTPAKNEERNLPGLAESILKQKLKPILWIIADDCSNDRTTEILANLSSQYLWIQVIRLNEQNKYDLGEHYAYVCRKGFKYAIDCATRNKINFEFIALSDADMLYPDDYFLKVIEFLKANEEYGIVSGKILIKDKEKIYEERTISIGEVYPRGTGRVWRRITFEQTNGYILTKSPDTVSNILASIKGWKLAQVNVVCYQTRDTGAGENLWKGYFNQGDRSYYLGANPLSLINSFVDLVFLSRQKSAFLKSIAYACGYMSSYIRKKERIEILAVRYAIGSYSITFKHYKDFIRSIVKKLIKK